MNVWVANSPSWLPLDPLDYPFIDFDDRRDRLDANREIDELSFLTSHNSSGGGGVGRCANGSGWFGSDLKCYECGEPGYLARECRMSGGSRRRRSHTSPRYH